MTAPPPVSASDCPLTITRLSRPTGVPTTTLRYHEREGLLAPAGRTRAGYRLYPPEAASRLRFIRTAQGIGLALKDVRVLLDMDARASRPEVRRLLETRLGEVESKLSDLSVVRDSLRDALARCRRSAGPCGVLVSLGIGGGTAFGEHDHDQEDGVDGIGRGRPSRGGRRGSDPALDGGT